MTKSNTQIRMDLNEIKANIINADSNTIDYAALKLKKYIEDDNDLKKIYDEQIKFYNELRDNTDFQNIIKENFDLIIKDFKKIGRDIYSYDYFTPMQMINPQNIMRDLTRLYFWNVDKLINEIIEMHTAAQRDEKYFYCLHDIKKELTSYNYPLLVRNISIYKYYYDISCYFENIERSINEKDIMMNFYNVIHLCNDSYDFFFFNLEINMTQINLKEQVKNACVNIIKYLLEQIQKKNNNEDTKLIEEKTKKETNKFNLTLEEIKIIELRKTLKDNTYKEIGKLLSPVLTEGNVTQKFMRIKNKLGANSPDEAVYIYYTNLEPYKDSYKDS